MFAAALAVAAVSIAPVDTFALFHIVDHFADIDKKPDSDQYGQYDRDYHLSPPEKYSRYSASPARRPKRRTHTIGSTQTKTENALRAFPAIV